MITGPRRSRLSGRVEEPVGRNAVSQGVHVSDGAKAETAFEFIDLFAGIGGLRLGLESIGGECVFSSEWDRFAQQTYEAWHGERPAGDINGIDPAEVPDHDILAGGFPCQPFSIAGVSKKISLGRAHGFDDLKQGNLFFATAEIIRAKRPSVVMLENVKNLLSHDRGRTWEVIAETLDKLDYEVHAQVIDAAGWVPQHRERIFIIAFNREVFGEVAAPLVYDLPHNITLPAGTAAAAAARDLIRLAMC